MKRFFGEKENNQIIIKGDEYFHIKKVLRMKEGDKIIACVNDEYDYYCTITELEKDFCKCEIESVEKNLALPNKNITLFQMLPKKEYIDNIIPKAIELGVNDIYFFTSKWSITKDLKKERVNSQVMTACKQCERSKLVKVHDIIKFEQIFEKLKNYDLVLFAYENESNNYFEPSLLNSKQNIAVIIGNEAGFTEEEANKIIDAGAQSISLGKRILRCDTAVTATLALVSILTKN